MTEAPEAGESQADDQCQHAQLAAVAAQFGAVGKPGAGDAGIGGDAVPADIHVGAARTEAGRNTRSCSG